MDEYTAADGIHSLVFTGDLLSEVSTNPAGSRLRWTELRLFRMISPAQAAAGAAPGTRAAGDYLVVTRGPSLVYHKAAGGCGKGSLTTVAELRHGSVHCQACWPPADRWLATGAAPEDLAPRDQVRAEGDRPRAIVCPEPADVEAALREEGGRKKDAHRLSSPAQQLLEDAARVDEGIRNMLSQVERISP